MYSHNKDLNNLLKRAEPFCSKIVRGQKHIKAFPFNSNIVIVISSTASDRNAIKQVKKDFLRSGVVL